MYAVWSLSKLCGKDDMDWITYIVIALFIIGITAFTLGPRMGI